MAWPPKIDAKELTGLSKEEFAAKVTEINQALTEAAAAQATATSAMTEVAAVRAQLQALEGRTQTPVVQQPNFSGGPVELPLWSEDADAAFNARMQSVVGPLVAATVQNQSRFVFEDVKSRMVAKDARYRLVADKAKELVLKQPAGLQVREDIIENCFKVMLADNYDQIQKDQAAKSGAFYTESSVNMGTSIIEDTRKPEEKLSDREREIASKMGISPKAYADAKATMNVVGV
jgi:hypothetical protein